MAIYLNGQLVAGSNDGLKSVTSAETVTSAGSVEQAEIVNVANIIKNYIGGIENITNITPSAGSVPDNMNDIANINCIYYDWISESDLNLYVYQPDIKIWKTFKLGGAI